LASWVQLKALLLLLLLLFRWGDWQLDVGRRL
jgi:hypothetical protein